MNADKVNQHTLGDNNDVPSTPPHLSASPKPPDRFLQHETTTCTLSARGSEANLQISRSHASSWPCRNAATPHDIVTVRERPRADGNGCNGTTYTWHRIGVPGATEGEQEAKGEVEHDWKRYGDGATVYSVQEQGERAQRQNKRASSRSKPRMADSCAIAVNSNSISTHRCHNLCHHHDGTTLFMCFFFFSFFSFGRVILLE